MKKWGLKSLPTTNTAIQNELITHGMSEKWKDYLTVLNLRNYGHTTNAVVTEMIYVHAKLLIVDDAVAVIGSANINDRSLNGNGDTELASVIVDNTNAQVTEVGQGIKIITRKFARDLRIQLWKKHLGMVVDQTTTGVQIQGLPTGIKLEQPLDAATIAGIKSLATNNRAAYNKVFTHTPRNEFKTMTQGRQAYNVTQNGKTELNLSALPALQSAYMSAGKHNVTAAMATLKESIKGFWVEMPLEWGTGSNSTPNSPENSPQAIAYNESTTSEVSA
jgi:phospholipase D1/2